MALQLPEGVTSAPASIDMTQTQYQYVVENSAGQLALCGAGAKPDGIQDGPAYIGEQCRYWTLPGKAFVKARCGGTFAQGDRLASDAMGRAVKAVAGNQVVGKAKEDGVLGRIVEVGGDSGVM